MPKARAVAFTVLQDVLLGKTPLRQSLANSQAFQNLNDIDRQFSRNLISTTLRHYGHIRQIIAGKLQHPLPPQAAPVELALALGITQLYYARVPDHAAVATSVGILEDSRFSRYKGLVNAILRRCANEREQRAAAPLAPLTNFPDWLQQSWVTAYGHDAASAAAAVLLLQPPLDVTVFENSEAFAKLTSGTLLPGGTVRLSSSGLIPDLPGFPEGAFQIQEAAASLPVKLLAESGLLGKTVIDACAAPGGKSIQLAKAGAIVTAIDHSAARLKTMQHNLTRCVADVRVVNADAGRWQPDAPVDIVLLDAPCSATGTLRRNPDVAWLKTPEMLDELVGVQEKLLRRAAGWVKPGGTLLYSVCSLQPNEGEAQIGAFLSAHPDWQRAPFRAADVPVPGAVNTDGDIRILPHYWADHGGIDGFFMARLVKTSA